MTWISQIIPTRRHVLIVAVGALVLAAGAATAYWALPRLVSDDRLRRAVTTHAATWSAGEIRLPEDAVVVSHRGRAITVEGVEFTGTIGGAEWQLTTNAITADLRILPLLRGEAAIETLTLEAPRLRLVDHDESALDALRDLPEEDAALPSLDGEVILTNARFVYEGPTGRQVGFAGMDLRLATTPDSAGLLLTGGLPAGSGRLDLQGRLDDPAAVFSGRGSDARLVLKGADGAGDADRPPQPQPDVPGATQETQVVSDLRRITAAMGLTGTGPVAIEGRIAATPRRLDIADARVSFGGLLAEGSLTVALTGAAPPFDQLDRVARGAVDVWRDAAAAIEAGTWRDAPVSLAFLDQVDVALAARLRDSRLGGQAFEARRLRLEAEEGDLRIDLAADGDLGRLRSEIALGTGRADGPSRLAVNGSLGGVDMGATGRSLLLLAPPPLVSPPELPEGKLDLGIDLTTRGSTLGAMVTDLEGVVNADAQDGSLAGADLAMTLEGLADGRKIMTEQDGPLIPSAGRTAFDQAQARIDFVPGVARLSAFRLSGERYDIDMRGEADLGSGALRAEGRAKLFQDVDSAGDPSPIVDLPFGLGGTLLEPVVAAGVPRSGNDLTTEAAAEGDRE